MALLVSNDPKVPPKQNPGAGVRQIAPTFDPEVPSGTGAVYGCRLSESIVNPTDCEMEVLACEMAVTVTVAGSVLVMVDTVGTVFGAVYTPRGVIEPQTEPAAPQVSCHVTAVFEVPVTVAANGTV